MSNTATRAGPLIVTAELVEIFEKNNPALAGIGAIMIDAGHWILDGDPEESKENVGAADPRTYNDTRRGMSNVTIPSIGA